MLIPIKIWQDFLEENIISIPMEDFPFEICWIDWNAEQGGKVFRLAENPGHGDAAPVISSFPNHHRSPCRGNWVRKEGTSSANTPSPSHSLFLSISLFFLNLLPLNHEIYGLKNSRTGESFALSVMYWSCLCRGKRPLLATPWTMPGPTIWIRDPLLPLPSRFRCTGVSHPAPLMIYIDEKDGTRKIERIEGRVDGRNEVVQEREINRNLQDPESNSNHSFDKGLWIAKSCRRHWPNSWLTWELIVTGIIDVEE